MWWCHLLWHLSRSLLPDTYFQDVVVLSDPFAEEENDILFLGEQSTSS